MGVKYTSDGKKTIVDFVGRLVNAGLNTNLGTIYWENFFGVFQVTGYCSCERCCGKRTGKALTKSGIEPRAGHTVAADPEVIPLGSRIEIEGTVYTAKDT